MQSSTTMHLSEIFAAVRRPGELGDHDPAPIIITRPPDVPKAVAQAKRRARRAPVYRPETIAAFDLSAPEVAQ